MGTFASVLVCFMAAVGAASVSPQGVEIPAGGRPLLSGNVSPSWTGQYANGFSEVVPVVGPGFAGAVRLTTHTRGNAWNVQFRIPIMAHVARGDALLLSFYARSPESSDESGQGFIRVTIEEKGPPWTKSLERTITVSREWRRFFFPCSSRDDYPPDGLYLAFGSGHVPQVVEIGDIRLLSYGKRLPAGELPKTRQTYPGRGPDAPWRAEALERIRKVRTAPFVLRVVDGSGRAVAGAAVRVAMKSHRFQFGCAVPAWRIADETDPANELFRKRFLELFNAGSFVNALKWPPWAGDWGPRHAREVAMSGLRWFKEHGLHFRGHVLVWPGWRHLPKFMRAYRDNPDADAIRKAVLDHIADETAATRGYVEEWDVINEPFHNHDLMDICGRDVMVDWFKEAHRHVPEARLALNDFGILVALTDNAHQDDYERNIKFLLDNGAPLSILGLQGHFGSAVPSPSRMVSILDRYARFGLPIRITEFTVATDDEQFRADFLRDAMIVAFSHPAVVGFQFWGTGQLLDGQLNPKPACKAYRELVFDRWWTNLKGRTGANGEFEGTGFLGRHEAVVEKDGRRAVVEFDLTTAGQRRQVTAVLK